ncbi:MAG: hypothetical protein N3G20_06160 [Verrucomicrobiae bacterium]|nr:hypothetical protein [Verrucomicrobiae bacterium]
MNRTRLSSGRLFHSVLALLWIRLATVIYAEAAAFQYPPLVSAWFFSATARAGVGYKDNVLLSGMLPYGSVFGMLGLEVFAYRAPLGGAEVRLFLEAERKQFTEARDTEKEQLVLGNFSISRQFGSGVTGIVGLEYSYIDQVFDASTTELDLGVVVARGHLLAAKPRIDVAVGERTRLCFEGTIGYQWLEKPLDDYSEAGPRLELAHEYGNRSEVGIAYQLLHRDYSTRMQASESGTLIPGTDLAYEMHRTVLHWRHNWTKSRSMRTTARLGLDSVHDNGSGYFDYQRYFGDASVAYEPGAWGVRARLGLARYEYAVQTVPSDGGALRHKTLVVLTLAATTRVTKRVALFAEYEHERSIGNQAFDRYNVNTVTTGIEAEF